MSNTTRGKRWCFTINNYTEQDINWCKLLDYKYLIYGLEHGAENGTPHIQGFVIMNERKTFVTMKNLLAQRAHLELARGTNQQNIDYCSKEGNCYEYGELPPERGRQGGEATKRKWEEAYNAAKEGDFDAIPPDLYIRYRNSFKAIYQEEVNRNTSAIGDWDLKHHFIWIYGPTGTGKSHMARSIAMTVDQEHPPYLKGLNKWWSGYQQEKVVIIEEASPESCKYLAPLFKQWCDKWPFAAETKGGHFEHGIRPEYIIITSNYSIAECFPEINDQEPMKRRCFEFYKETRESWLPFDFNEFNDATQVIPPTQTLAMQGTGDTQIDISKDSPSYDEALLKIAKPL